MKSYILKVADKKGRKTTILKTTLSEDMAVRDAQQEGYLILDVKESISGEKSQESTKRVPEKLVLDFTSSLSILLSSGLGLKESIKVSRDIFKPGPSRDFVNELSDGLDRGASLFDSLSPYGRSFGSLYMSLIRIGEKAGDLFPIFARLTEYTQTNKTIKDKLGNALVYPLMVLSVSLIGTILLMVFVFPQLISIISSVSKESSAQFQQNIQSFQGGFIVFLIILGIGALGVAGARIFQRVNTEFRIWWHGLFLKAPVSRSVLEVFHGLNFCFAMETLLMGGYSVEDSLSEAAGTVSNAALRAQIFRLREQVIRGKTLSEAMNMEKVFSDRFRTWIRVGEKAGDMTKVFSQLRKYYQQALDSLGSKAMNLVEPGMILIVGVFVLTLIMNFVTPIFSILGNIVK